MLFVPCEKAIIGADGSLSIVNVLQNAVLTIPPSESLDPNTIVGHEWQVVSLWQQEPGDQGERFQQRVTMTDPTGTLRLQSFTEFDLPKTYHRNISRIQGFPVTPEGEYTLRLSIRNVKTNDWVEKASYPLLVAIRSSDAPTSQSPSAAPSETST
jgi:hypothetical protein